MNPVRTTRTLPLLVLPVLFLAAPVFASPAVSSLHVDVTTATATAVTGASTIEATLAGWQLFEVDGEPPPVAIDGEGTLTIYRHSIAYAQTDDDATVDHTYAFLWEEAPVEVAQYDVTSLEFEEVYPTPFIDFRFGPARAAALDANGLLRIEPPGLVGGGHTTSDVATDVTQVASEQGFDQGQTSAVEISTPVNEWNGSIEAFLFNTRIVADGETVDLVAKTNDSRSAFVPGVGGQRVVDRYYGIYQGDAVIAGLPTVMASGLRLSGGMDVFLHEATGEVIADGTDYELSGETLQFMGDGNSTMQVQADRQHWTYEGSGSFVAVDAVAVAGERDNLLLAGAAAAGTAAIGALLWAWFTGILREGLALVGLRTADPLANDNRLQILQTITHQPGITPAMLTQELGLGRATVNHHLRVLERASLISRHQDGKIPSWTLNSGSMDFALNPVDPTDSSTPQTARSGFASVGHPKRRMILDALTELGEADYATLKPYWTQQGTTKALRADEVSYHAGIMAKAGLVRRRREGRRVLWSPVVKPTRAVEEQLVNFLRDHNAAAVLAHLVTNQNPRPGPLRDVAPTRKTRRHLRLLEGVGLVTIDKEKNLVKPHRLAASVARRIDPAR